MVATQSATSTQAYRIYLRDAKNQLAQGHDFALTQGDGHRRSAPRPVEHRGGDDVTFKKILYV
jgi:hypothetical protein